ncbi:MAG: hypothetical protein H7Y88_13545 [Phycisphaerales bacterium]|nr:hypothetical protein [Phycisphaerales bacterium]
MTDEKIPPAVRLLLSERIESAGQLEVLLLVHARPEEVWTAAAVGKELRTDVGWTAEQLGILTKRGLLRHEVGGGAGYRGTAASAELQEAVAVLAKTYGERRVAVISLIYSKPPDRLRTFAEAFRLRADESGSQGSGGGVGGEGDGS